MTSLATQPAASDNAPTVAAVEVEQLRKSYDDKRVLRDLSFRIPQGRFTALLGANGAGKTTLLKILATLLPPTSGKIPLLGPHPQRECAKTRARLGLIGHYAMLYRDLSPLENLVFFGGLYGVPAPEKRARELLSYVELADRADDPVKTFSRGMVQRVSIARALMHDPDLLLADEPFAGLDAPSTRLLEEMLTRLSGAGKTIVLCNHDIEQSLRLVEHVLVLRKGALIRDEAAAGVDAEMILREVAHA
ncbi:MAG: ABC transporter ATP-binding protein [Phycisphaerales bacterium JB038]